MTGTIGDQLAVVAYPAVPATDAARIEAIRHDHDPQHGRIAAHFTLMFPTSGLDIALVRNRLHQVARTEPPFAVVLRTVAPFHEREASYVFLLPDPRDGALARLHARLGDGLAIGVHSDTPPYQPHVTVARLAERDPADALAARLAAGWRPVAANVDTLVLLRIPPLSPVVEIERASLTGRRDRIHT